MMAIAIIANSINQETDKPIKLKFQTPYSSEIDRLRRKGHNYIWKKRNSYMY